MILSPSTTGARPLCSAELIDQVVQAAHQYGAAVPGVKPKDSLKIRQGGMIREDVDRESLIAVQTPQVFPFEEYDAALGYCMEQHRTCTDDAAVYAVLQKPIHIVEGDYRNIKVTTPEDVAIAGDVFKGGFCVRIGHGYDAHRLVPGRALILGGVSIAHEKGLLGHSDADVLTHAVMDALLGALALGDIGAHFPDSDAAVAGADSLALLRRVLELVEGKGYRIGNLDATLLAQRPKLAPYIAEMRKNLARACGVAPDAVSVKATTEEGMGFTRKGRGHCLPLRMPFVAKTS